MNRHRRALQLIAEARPAVLDDAPDRPVPSFPLTISEAPAPARLGRRLILAAAVPAVVAAVAVVYVESKPTVAPLPPPAATARRILLTAAEHTTTASPSATGSFWVTRQELHHLYDVGGYSVVGRTELETWFGLRPGSGVISVSRSLGAAPATDADRAAWRAAGSPAKWTLPGPAGQRGRELSAAPSPRDVSVNPDGGFGIAGTPLTYAQVQALPTDPAKLKAYLIARDTAAGHDGTWTPDQLARWYVEMLFTQSWELLAQLPVSPATRAATYRMLADLPGLTTENNVHDATGRPGAAIGYTYRVDDRTVPTRLIIDPESGALLSRDEDPEAWILLDTHFSNATPPHA